MRFVRVITALGLGGLAALALPAFVSASSATYLHCAPHGVITAQMRRALCAEVSVHLQQATQHKVQVVSATDLAELGSTTSVVRVDILRAKPLLRARLSWRTASQPGWQLGAEMGLMVADTAQSASHMKTLAKGLVATSPELPAILKH